MKNLGTFWDLILKPINYSLDYAIKIIGIFGLIWGIYILIPGFYTKVCKPLVC